MKEAKELSTADLAEIQSYFMELYVSSAVHPHDRSAVGNYNCRLWYQAVMRFLSNTSQQE
jgi:hypothetical protein